MESLWGRSTHSQYGEGQSKDPLELSFGFLDLLFSLLTGFSPLFFQLNCPVPLTVTQLRRGEREASIGILPRRMGAAVSNTGRQCEDIVVIRTGRGG